MPTKQHDVPSGVRERGDVHKTSEALQATVVEEKYNKFHRRFRSLFQQIFNVFFLLLLLFRLETIGNSV